MKMYNSIIQLLLSHVSILLHFFNIYIFTNVCHSDISHAHTNTKTWQIYIDHGSRYYIHTQTQIDNI